ncbi:MAG TPA: hypothetical protein VKB38_00135 [Terracidiphilus sp.]|nr:hypothetical protein [Terracidiphilus sp.]
MGLNDSVGTRIDEVQRVLALRAGKSQFSPLVANYEELDVFLRENHEALKSFYGWSSGVPKK